MTFVLDASVAASWFLPDELNAVATEARSRIMRGGARAPGLWWYEIRNVLITNERKNRLPAGAADIAASMIRKLPITLDHDPRELSILTLCRQHRLTVYDAAYLELALREALPLATLDAALISAARAEGVRLLAQA
ncbi:MAG: type II toxin-antitoxin system VapC family toxin [Elsteraceae bacterium]